MAKDPGIIPGWRIKIPQTTHGLALPSPPKIVKVNNKFTFELKSGASHLPLLLFQKNNKASTSPYNCPLNTEGQLYHLSISLPFSTPNICLYIHHSVSGMVFRLLNQPHNPPEDTLRSGHHSFKMSLTENQMQNLLDKHITLFIS